MDHQEGAHGNFPQCVCPWTALPLIPLPGRGPRHGTGLRLFAQRGAAAFDDFAYLIPGRATRLRDHQ